VNYFIYLSVHKIYKISFLIIFSLIFATIGITQTSEELIMEGKQLVDKGIVSSDLSYLNEGRERFETVLTDDSENYLANYFLAYANYRLAIYSLQNNEKEQFENFIGYSIEELNKLLESNDNNSEVFALLASAYAFQISAKPDLGSEFGPIAFYLIFKAYDIDPHNPRVMLLSGLSYFNIPKDYGGSKLKALDDFIKSVKLFENATDEDDDIAWGYTDALAWLGIAYSEQNDYESAVEVYNKALEVAPDFLWVKNILLPAAENKLN